MKRVSIKKRILSIISVLSKRWEKGHCIICDRNFKKHSNNPVKSIVHPSIGKVFICRRHPS